MNRIKLFFLALCLTALLTSCSRRYTHWYDIRNLHAAWEQEELTSLPLPSPSLSLDDCITLGLERNLDLLVLAWEADIQKEIATREMWSMLPKLNFEFEDKGRDTEPGSSSQSLVPGIPPAPPSVSTEKNSRRTQLVLSWNIIDFGLSYYLAQQEKDRAFLKRLELQRLQQNLIQEIIEEFWKASTAQVAVSGSRDLLVRAREQKESIDRLITGRVLPEMKGLESEYTLLDIELQLQDYEKIYSESIFHLKELMGLHPSTEFSLIIPQMQPIPPEINRVEPLEELAVLHRPELYGKDLEERIAIFEARVALLRAFPGLELFTSLNHDANKFLVENHWLTAGLRITKDLLSFPRHLQDYKMSQHKHPHAQADRLKMALGVLTQVHLACHLYQDERKHYALLQEIHSVRQRLHEAAIKSREYGEFDAFQLIQYERDALMSQVETLKAYGAVSASLQKVNNAIGIPFYYDLAMPTLGAHR